MTAKLVLLAMFVMSMLMISYRKKKKRVVFFGDSITKHGNEWGGFIKLIQKFLVNEELEENYELIASGVSGNKVTDLAQRIDKDVLAKGADIVILFVGVNDVWHKKHGGGTDLSAFNLVYKQLVERLLTAETKLVLCTPAAIGEKHFPENTQDLDLEDYCNLIRHYSHEYEVQLVDLRTAFKEYSLQNNPDNFERSILTTDGVHLNDAGNKLVAEKIWNALFPLLAPSASS